ncbi:Kelch repeat-containing protein [Metarhizium anisopliae]
MAPLLLASIGLVATQNPRDNFCRRFSHQTVVIDDKLYIDGGWVNFDDFQQSHQNYPSASNVVVQMERSRQDVANSAFKILGSDITTLTIYGGALWGDDVNKRFYLYGGDWDSGYARETYRLLSYDILYDKWDDFGTPSINPPPEIASFGAGVGVSETGNGYYYGGWISNASMSGWTKSRTMSSSFYSYAYEAGTFTQAAGPDNNTRAEGAMVWIPAGDIQGLLVYMGGVVANPGNGTVAPQPFDKIFVFDATGNSWLTQTATGVVPQNRRQFCIDVAWAPDRSSYNIYLWGGLSVPPPLVNTTSFNDVYILTLPSFTWVKAYPDHQGNATLPPAYGHYSASCNMVKSMSQLFVVGGTYPDTNACDLAVDAWAQHNFWTGTYHNQGDNKTYWALFDPNVTNNVVPVDVYSVVGGNKSGGATLTSPKGGFDPGNKPLQDLMGRKPTIPSRSPTRQIASPTNTPTHAPPPVPGPGLSGGAIAGIVIGSVAGAALLLFVWFLMGRRVVRRRKERRQSVMTQDARLYSVSSTAAPPSMVASIEPSGYVASRWSRPESPQEPSELPSQQDGRLRDILGSVSELPPAGGEDGVKP